MARRKLNIEDHPHLVDPSEYVPKDQCIVYSSAIWKLKSDGDPLTMKCWDKRTMWLTNAGGLFYYSVEKKMPLGQNISGIRVQVLGKMMEYFAFEIVSTNGNTPDSSARRRVFASDNDTERDEWIAHIKNVQARCAADAEDTLSPMDLFKKTEGPKKRCISRRRSSGKKLDDVTAKSPSSQSRLYGKKGQSQAYPAQADGQEEDFAKKRVRRQSQELWYMRSHSVLILDWDDTIFPTTWIRKDCDFSWKVPLQEQLEPNTERTEIVTSLLEAHLERVEQFLNQAVFFANVFIVTLAKKPWVETSMENFMPELRPILEREGIEVIYAQEYLTENMRSEEQSQFRSSEEMVKFWTRVKGEAISHALHEFHEKNQSSWKNILSCGDSDFERYATIAVGSDYVKREVKSGREIVPGTATNSEASSVQRVIRVKTMKMLDDPTIEELMAQLSLLTIWLPCLVRRDGDINVEFPNSEDDKALTELNTVITEENTRISWSQFDGM